MSAETPNMGIGEPTWEAVIGNWFANLFVSTPPSVASFASSAARPTVESSETAWPEWIENVYVASGATAVKPGVVATL